MTESALRTSGERRVALVTGASRGIGAAIARRFAAEGFDLTLAARSEQPLRELASELTASHGIRVEVLTADMSDEESVRSLAAYHRDSHGSLDVLVLNAGMGSIGPVASFPVRRFDMMFSVNLRSAHILIQEMLPLLRDAGSKTRGGRVVAVASTTGLVGEPLNAAYGATKAGLITYCEALSTEESVNGVSATALCPGYVATAMTEGLADTVSQDSMLAVDDIAEMALSLTRLGRTAVIPHIAITRPGPHVWRA